MAGAEERKGSLPQIRSESDLDHIRNFPSAFAFMEREGIPTDDVGDLASALACIKTHFRWGSAPTYNEQDRELKEAVQADHENRQKLSELFSKARDYLDGLPEYFRQDLQLMFPAFPATMDDTLAQLQQLERLIVVAGETGSGKSSLVNLLAGCKILPTDLVTGTRTICELRHSETSRRMVLYHSADGQAPVTKECPLGQEAGPFLAELTRVVTLVDQSTNKSPFERVEIFWPLPVLGEGVVLVDSPGVGESRTVSHQLEQYMSRAFGFIYVLNISNAGGIHKDRLGQLLHQAVERSDQSFDPSTALFVCNWWDQVGPGDQEHVLRETLSRLARMWPGVRPQQVFPLSCKESLKALERRQVDNRYLQLVQGIRQVLPVTFNVKLTQYHRWLSAVLKRSLYSLKISYNMGHKQVTEKEASFRNVQNQILRLEKESDEKIDILRTNFRIEVANITRKLTAFLRSDHCQQEMTRWTPAECPPHEKDAKTMVKEASYACAGRLATLVDAWEKQNNVVDNTRVNVLKAFQRNLELFGDQVNRLEGVLFQGIDKRIVRDLHQSMKHQMPVKNVWRKARRDKKGAQGAADVDVCFTLGNAVSSGKHLDPKGDPAVKHVFRGGIGPRTMCEACRLFLRQITDQDVASATEKFFDRIAKRFDATSELLAEFLKADRNLLRPLQEEVQGDHLMLSVTYPDLLRSVTDLQGSLDMFLVESLLRFDFGMEELQYDPIPIGSGNFADVYGCTLPSGEQVALKIQKEALDTKNVTDVLLEDRTLRDLDHDNIIRYYGAAMEKTKQGALKWVMVLEFCSCNLKQHIRSEEYKAPGQPEMAETASLRLDAMREVAQLARQISGPLCYLHSKGIVHRDLKPDNILLTEENVVKLTDMGLAKPVRDLSGTIVGTPAYMAPEVMLEAGHYDVKADVYSLSLVVWELWYGRAVADDLRHRLFGPLDKCIEEGLRPALTDIHKPPENWAGLIQAGWDHSVERRPSSQDFSDFFDSFLSGGFESAA